MIIKPKRGQKISVASSELTYKLVWGMIELLQEFDQDKEHFFVIGVNRALNVRFLDWVSMGTMHATVVEPREVFRAAVLHGASSIIIAHNHPSDYVRPSIQDRETTDTLVQAGKILKIRVIDHVVVYSSGYYSFSDEGVLD